MLPSGSEPPLSLALDDIMLIEDDEEGNQNNSSDAKILDIQDQLQKQAEIIRDLLVQRDYLINQILQERDRWQAEREGWDRTSEALVARHARKDRDSDSGKEEELTHLCAVYESDNKALKEKLHNTQARLTDLETELSKLKPLLVMQPHLLPQPYGQESTRRPMSYPYVQMHSYISPFPPAPTQYAPSSSYNETITPVSVNRRKRRGDHLVDPSSNKGKGKEGPSNEAGSDSNEDGDTDTEAPPTPTPTPASSSWNPYAYMNSFNRQGASSTKPSPLKPPDVFSSPTINGYPVSYPYSYIVSPFSKQTSAPNSGASIPYRHDKADKDEGHGEPNTESQRDKFQPRRTMGTTSRTQHQVKHKTSTFLSDARAEHLLLAARRIGRERAAAIAGIIKVQDKLVVVPEATTSTTKDRAKATEQASGVPSSSTAKRSAPLKSRPTLIQSPSTPTPRRIHGPGDKMLLSSPLAHPLSSSIGTTNTARSRDTLVSSTRSITRTLSTISSGVNASSNEDMAPGSGQTPLDSLLSAARTMMSEDCEAPTHGHRLTVSDGAIGATDRSEDLSRSQPPSQVERRDVEESIQRKKRRRNTTTTATTRSPATPRLRTITEKQRGNTSTPSTGPDWEINSTLAAKHVPGVIQVHSSLSTQRTRSALDVLADQAAAASSDGSGIGSTTNIERSRSEVDDQGAGAVHDRHDTQSTPPSSASYSVPHLINEEGAPVEPSLVFMQDYRVPYREETTQSGMASSLPRQCSVSDEDVTTEYDTQVYPNKPKLPPLDGDNILNVLALLPGAEAPPLPDTAAAAATIDTTTTTASTKVVSLSSEGSDDPALFEAHSTSYPDRNMILQVHGKPRKNNSEFHGSDPFGSRPNLGSTINEPGAECISLSSEGGDLDAEGDIDPDSQDV